MFTLIKTSLDILLPKTCFFCHKLGRDLCEDCECKRFKPFKRRFCHVCHGILRVPGRYIHRLCIPRTNLDGVFSSYILNDHLKRYIKSIKYSLHTSMLTDLYPYLDVDIPINYDIISFVPLHKRRQNYRGFNQAELLSKLIDPNSRNLLERIKDTKYQSLLYRNERKDNVRGSFVCTNTSLVKSKEILLVDDIYTTGSTLESCAYSLKRSGAKKVYAYTIGIDELPSDALIIEQSIKTM